MFGFSESKEVYITHDLALCRGATGSVYIMEQVKPQHSFSRVRPVLVTYGVEVCCPLEVIFFSLAGAKKKDLVTLMEQQISTGLAPTVQCQCHLLWLSSLSGLRVWTHNTFTLVHFI